MEYYKIGVEKFVQINGNNAWVFYRTDLLQQQQDIQDRINAIPKPTSTELLNWAKLNYPTVMDTVAAQAELDRINVILGAIKNL